MRHRGIYLASKDVDKQEVRMRSRAGFGKAVLVVLAVAVVFAVGMPSLSAETNFDDEAVATALVKGSPCSGKWIRTLDNRGGEMDLTLEMQDGVLKARIENLSGAMMNFAGPVTELKLQNGQVTFINSIGWAYKLEYKNGVLSGMMRGPIVNHYIDLKCRA